MYSPVRDSPASAAATVRGAGTAPPPNSAAEQELVERLTRAFETADVDGIVALLTDDAWLSMPPLPLQYQGRELAAGKTYPGRPRRFSWP